MRLLERPRDQWWARDRLSDRGGVLRQGQAAVGRSGDGAWRIMDVYLDGKVSELALRRSEYFAVVEREGFVFLVSSLEEKLPTAPKGAESQ